MNFTVHDLCFTLLGSFAWLILLMMPGLIVGHLTNVLRFRNRCLLRRLALGTLVSLLTTPIVVNLLAMTVGISACIIVIRVLALAMLCLLLCQVQRFRLRARHFRWQLRSVRVLTFALCAWVIIALALLIDIQIGDRLFLSMLDYDQSNMVGFVDSILRFGLPPTNPTYFPGRPMAVMYHYFWPLMCGLVAATVGQSADTRPFVISGCLWSGGAFLLCLSFWARSLQLPRLPARLVCAASMSLVWISALYGPIVLFLRECKGANILYINNWTRDLITGSFLEVMTWVPHHVAGLTACLFCALILLSKVDERQAAGRLVICILGVASAIGLAAYIAVAFGLILIVRAVAALRNGRLRDSLFITTVGAFGLLLCAPFLIQLKGEHQNIAPLVFSVRFFEVITESIPRFWILPQPTQELIKLACLPVNFVCGFGFSLFATILFWQHNKTAWKDERQRFLLTAVCVATVLGTFLRSPRSNDLAMRIMLFTNVALNLWSAQFIAQRIAENGRVKLAPAHWALLSIGIFTTVYAFYLERTEMETLHDSRHVFAMRQIYSELNRKIPVNFVVQHNPLMSPTDPTNADLFALLYSHHQCAMSEHWKGLLNPPNYREYVLTAHAIERMFDSADGSDALRTCKRLNINVVLVKDKDKIWAQKNSWLSKFPILAENSYARAYLVRSQNDG